MHLQPAPKDKDAKLAASKRSAPEPEQKVKKQRMVEVHAAKAEPAAKPSKKVKAEEEEDDKGAQTAVEEQRDWDDLDAGDECDPLMVSEYVVEIFEYLQQLEVQ